MPSMSRKASKPMPKFEVGTYHFVIMISPWDFAFCCLMADIY